MTLQYISDEMISADFFEDDYLKKYIYENGIFGTCSFSQMRRKVVSVVCIVDVIMKGIRKEYDYAENSLPQDSEEEVGFGPKPIDTYDLVHEEIAYEAGIEDEKVLNSIYSKLENRYWSNIFAEMDRSERFSKWDEYCSLLEKSRLSAEQIIAVRNHVPLEHPVRKICEFLDDIYDYCRRLDLIEDFKPEESIYKCVDYIGSDFSDVYGIGYIPASFIGTSLPTYSKDNRMNEAGDSMFYGSGNIRTILLESNADKTENINKGKQYTIGKFHVNKRIKVLDLYRKVNLMRIPSLFDLENAEQREVCLFMKKFSREISKPQSESSVYRPTQVLTKYFQRTDYIKGIRYGSSKDREAFNTVLFVDTNDCIEKSDSVVMERVQLIKDKYAEPKTYKEIENNNYNISWI